MYINRSLPNPPSRMNNLVKLAYTKQTDFLTRKADILGTGMGYNTMSMLWDGPVLRMSMKPFSPLFQESNLMLPKERRTMNAINRHYYENDYWVGNAIELHTTYPLGGFEIVSKDKEVEKVMLQMAQRINLKDVVMAVGLQYWMFGEAFPFLEWDPYNKMWGRATILNPDLIDVKKTIFSQRPIITLMPDSELKRICTSTHPADVAIRATIPQYILDFVLRGENIPLNYRNVSHIYRKTVWHDTRGVSIIQRVWKELMLRDAFREVLFVISQNHITPLKIFKIGGKDKDYFPGENDLEYWRMIIEEAQNDPNYSIITHDAVDVQYVGATGHILDVSSYIKLFEDHILTGLQVSKVLITGEGPSYANASVAYEVQQQRYVFFRSIIENWLVNKVFLPVAIHHGFKDNQGRYKVPMIKWRRMDFMKDNEWRRHITELSKPQEGGMPVVSKRTLLTELGLDPDQEEEFVIKEKIKEMQQRKGLKDLSKQMSGGGLEGLGLGGLGGGLGGGELGGLGGGLGGGELGGLGGGEAAPGTPPPEAAFSGAGAPPAGGEATEFPTPAL